jgi:hypothetical protein
LVITDASSASSGIAISSAAGMIHFFKFMRVLSLARGGV